MSKTVNDMLNNAVDIGSISLFAKMSDQITKYSDVCFYLSRAMAFDDKQFALKMYQIILEKVNKELLQQIIKSNDIISIAMLNNHLELVKAILQSKKENSVLDKNFLEFSLKFSIERLKNTDMSKLLQKYID
jgi:hypothetical protein